MQLWPYNLASENVIEMENLSLIPEQYGIYELFLIKPISFMEYPSKRQRIKLDRKKEQYGENGQLTCMARLGFGNPDNWIIPNISTMLDSMITKGIMGFSF